MIALTGSLDWFELGNLYGETPPLITSLYVYIWQDNVMFWSSYVEKSGSSYSLEDEF